MNELTTAPVPAVATRTCAGDVPGFAIPKLTTVARGVPGAVPAPGAGTSQWVLAADVPALAPHTGGVEPAAACTERATTRPTEELTVTAYGD